jgi:hypothetical protein
MAYSDADRLLTVRGTLTYPDTETQALTSTHISSFIVNEDAGRDVPVGAAPASSFELKLDNSSGQWEPGGSILGAHVLDGAKVEIEIGLWNGATYDYSDIGTYYVDDVQGQEHETLIRLKGSDAMVSLMSEYYADGAGDYPQTLGSLLTDVASVAGVTLESAVFTNSAVSIPAQPAWKNNLTCREAVGYIAACAGGIARFNRAGKLEIAPLEKVSSRAVSTSVYKTIQKGDTSFGGLNAINVYAYGAPDGTSPVRYATTPATPDTSLNSINIKGNPILAHGSTALAALGAGMLSALTGLAFRGATFEWHGDPTVELGELCTVTDLSSTAIPILITKQTLRFASGFSMNSGCTVTTSTKADASGKLQKIFTPTGNLNAEALAGNIYVKAGEKMTLESGGNLNLLAGGNLNIKNLGNTANVINMDSTGMTLSSTGQINVASGGKINLTSANDLMIGAQNITAFADGRIDAKASTIDLSANNSIKLAVSGGTNVVPGTRDLTWFNFQNATITNYTGTRTTRTRVKSTASGNSAFSARTAYDIVLLPNSTYTLSFLLDANFVPLNYSAFLPLGGGTQILLPSVTGWENAVGKNSLTFTTPSTVASSYALMLGASNANLTTGFRFYVEEVKIEKGTHATDWSPSPSDPASGVKTSKIEIGSDFIDIESGGTLTLDAADDIKIGSGSDTLASTIDLSANDSIKLAVTNQSANLFPSDPSNWEQGGILFADGSPTTSTTRIKSAGYITLNPGTLYTVSRVKSLTGQIRLCYFNNSNAYIGNSEEWVATSPYSFSLPSGATKMRVVVRNADNGTIVPTDVPDILFSIVPAGVSGGVKTSSVEVNSNGIYMDTTGTFNVNAGVGVNIRGGSGASSIGISNNDANNYFLWAGHGTPASAPFSVKRDGSVKATKIQHEMPYTFWDMADGSTPAEFPVYIPAGYTINSVTFTFQTKKARTFAKSAASGGGSTSGAPSTSSTGSSSANSTNSADGRVGAHTHTMLHTHGLNSHTHSTPAHAHGINYGINEKSTLATSCALKVGATTIGTYSPNPSNPVEIKAHMSAGWNTVIVAPNNDARIVAFALVKLTPA